MGARIFLIGFMGTGKTTVGEQLASALDVPLFDSDQEIVKREGRSIPEIFAADGEVHFRKLETAMLTELAAGGPAVITTGGGAVLAAENRDMMKKSGFVVCLTATVEEIVRRVENDPNRPLLQGGDLKGRILALQEARAGLYEFADLALDTTGRSLADIVGEIVMKLSAS
ncbi:shikimate kinase [Tumebacillus flagellatus]|uniref:Shikimate kinase n=1 Tax=Tumebacillus flagellatus TaxID=1157490 RepID=A0A074LQA4_9BACL|nr:shikimate kinase [Tumebacillus flagellatus]KEO82655.1 hypothetical protein EL26_13900 [Tumebacillus flagellatus]